MTIRDNVEAVHRLLDEDLQDHAPARDHRLLDGRAAGVSVGRQLSRRSPIASSRRRAPRRPTATASCGSRVRSPRSPPIATFNDGDYTAPPTKGHRSVRHGLGRLALLAGVVAPRAVEDDAPPGTTLEQYMQTLPTNFIPGADANDLILQARTWEQHDVGTTPGFNGDVEKALRSIKVPLLYMPSETDLYFPVGDARYEAQFMPTSRCCRFRRSGAIRPARARPRRTATFSTRNREVSRRREALREASRCRSG